MFSEQRQHKILEILRADQFVRAADLQRMLHASQASIRRDLQTLEGAGLLKRTHGGASAIMTAGFEPSLEQKEDRFRTEKAAMAKVAVSLIRDGDTIMLDAGSTTLQIARALRHRHKIKVVTNAVNIASELSDSDLEVTVTGGTLRRNTLALVGPLTGSTLSELHVDKLFLATNGLDLQAGITSPNLVEAEAKKAMIESAREVIVVTDHSKFGRVAFTQVCPLHRIHVLITDEGAPAEFLRELEKQHITVHLAPLHKS
jgi:DeoR family fructose operon transcriptional repressor